MSMVTSDQAFIFPQKSKQMEEPFDKTTWAKKLDTGLEAITFLEVNDPTNVINEAVDNLFANMAENESACEEIIENISNEAYRNVALARLRHKKIERFAAVLPDAFMYPSSSEDDAMSSDEFDTSVFQLWANVNKSLLGLEEAITCLQEDIAIAIRQRIELPNFDEDFQSWMDTENEALRARADDDKKRLDIDDKISNAVQSGAASSIIFLLVAAALLAPLVSMCSQQ